MLENASFGSLLRLEVVCAVASIVRLVEEHLLRVKAADHLL